MLGGRLLWPKGRVIKAEVSLIAMATIDQAPALLVAAASSEK